jgi:hypothetical protein
MSRLARAYLLLLLSGLVTLLLADRAQAQCSARDVMRRQPEIAETLTLAVRPKVIEAAVATKIWKSIQIGNFSSKRLLYGALEDADCGIGDTAEEMLVMPEFTLSAVATKLNIVVLSVSELGLGQENEALGDIYAQAQKVGFKLCPPEVGPQLRLQYFEQPIGEFLNIAMAPIRTRSGPSGIFSVGNGGDGLLLIGDEVSSDTKFYQLTRFVFVRPAEPSPLNPEAANGTKPTSGNGSLTSAFDP